MTFYEYKVVPAPERAPKVKGLKGTAKFAHGLEALMNEFAQDGWEFQRAESLPEEEKKGLMGGREIVTRNVLVFRRELAFEEEATEAPAAASAPPPLTLSRRSEAAEPARAEDYAQPALEPEMEADMDDIYAGAQVDPADPEEPARPERRPLVADRKGQGVDF
ncbi:MAG: DUF4177 domain-containing protein [Pseudomonadota bacterium]